MSIEDDLLPGDEDAILGDLERSDPTVLMADKIKAMMRHMADSKLLDQLGDFASGGIFNRSTQLPVIPFEAKDEAILPMRYLDTYGVKIMRPEHTIRITNV